MSAASLEYVKPLHCSAVYFCIWIGLICVVFQRIRLVPPITRPWTIECPIDLTKTVAHGMIVPVRANFLSNEVTTHLDRFIVLSGLFFSWLLFRIGLLLH
jgi:hypothetical protein